MAGPAMVRGEALAGEAAVEHRTIGAWRGGADDRGQVESDGTSHKL